MLKGYKYTHIAVQRKTNWKTFSNLIAACSILTAKHMYTHLSITTMFLCDKLCIYFIWWKLTSRNKYKISIFLRIYNFHFYIPRIFQHHNKNKTKFLYTLVRHTAVIFLCYLYDSICIVMLRSDTTSSHWMFGPLCTNVNCVYPSAVCNNNVQFVVKYLYTICTM